MLIPFPIVLFDPEHITTRLNNITSVYIIIMCLDEQAYR